ncbi:hypothetical protein GOODEAATRI_022296, partial [Goodea atripinnis]
LPPPSSEVKRKQEVVKEEVSMENSKQLSACSLRLPACRISESVQQLMELAVNTLCEAVGSSTQWSYKPNIVPVEMNFCHFTPSRENLLKFPHLAAVQHNNCMYLAHHLLTLGHHFRAHLPQPLSEGVATFCFLAQLNVQRAELIERLSTAHNFCNLDDEDNYIAASKAVRQVIHQLKQLGTVWQDVLPVSIYCKAMGNLLNTAITEIIAKIMMLEVCFYFFFIALYSHVALGLCVMEDGEHLHTLCQTIIEEGPLVFIPLAEENKNKKYQEEVPLYVKKWSTFKELVIVLRANLQEIVDSGVHLPARLGPSPRGGLNVPAVLRRWLPGWETTGVSVAARGRPTSSSSYRAEHRETEGQFRQRPSETVIYRREALTRDSFLFSPRDFLMGSYIGKPESPTAESGRPRPGRNPREQLRERLARPNYAVYTPNRRLSFTG